MIDTETSNLFPRVCLETASELAWRICWQHDVIWHLVAPKLLLMLCEGAAVTVETQACCLLITRLQIQTTGPFPFNTSRQGRNVHFHPVSTLQNQFT